ncbi:MAG: hypothetical protein RH917_13490 [Lacipirellulaceae bacterium]
MLLTPQTTPIAHPFSLGDFRSLPLGTSRPTLNPAWTPDEEQELVPWAPAADVVCDGDDPFDDFEEDDFDDDFDDDFEEDWEDDLTQDDEFPDTFGGHEEEEEDDDEDDSDTPFKDDPDFDE